MDTRQHIIYELRIGSDRYIGVTAKTCDTISKSVFSRLAKHWYRAHSEGLDWLLCQALRSLPSREAVEVVIHELVQGKTEAHRRERALIHQLTPNLNTDVR